MAALVIVLAYLLLPSGFPYMPLLGALLLVHGKRIDLSAIDAWFVVVVLWFALILFRAHSLVSSIQFAACLASLVLFSIADGRRLMKHIGDIVIIFSICNILIIFAEPVGVLPPIIVETMFLTGDFGGQRYRFVFPEPNHFAFFISFCSIMAQPEIMKKTVSYQMIVGGGLLFVAIASGSPMAYAGLALYAARYFFQSSPRGKLVSLALVFGSITIFWFFTPENILYRFTLLMYGEDNSVNLRTWGSFQIALYTLQDINQELFGGGLGSSRGLLYDNIYMFEFAAGSESTLPSFLGTMFIEGGYYLLFGFSLMIIGLFFKSRKNITLFLGTILLATYLVSSSFFYDTVSWTAIGIICNLLRRSRRPQAIPA